MPLRLRAAKRESRLERLKVFYACTGYPHCKTTHFATHEGHPVGELVKRPLREARKRAWELFKTVIESHGKERAVSRLEQLFGASRVSELNEQECEELCHRIYMRKIEAYLPKKKKKKKEKK